MKWDEIFININVLSDTELESYISRLQTSTLSTAGHAGGRAVWMTNMLVIAAAEKNSQAASRLAKTAIGIALAGVAIAAVGMWQ